MTKTCGFRHIAVGVMALLAVSPAVFAATATIDFDTSGAGINCALPRVPPLFNRPAYGSQTAAYIQTPTGCDKGALGIDFGNDSLLQNTAGLYLSAPYSNELRWSWVSNTDDNTWLRLLTYAAQSVTPDRQAPIISFEPGSSVAMDILVYGVDATGAEVVTGGLEFCLTARETGQNLPLGVKGSTTGTVEYLGVTGTGGGGATPDTRTPVGGVLLTDSATWYHVVWTVVDSTHVDVDVNGTVSNLLVAAFPGSGNGTLSATPANRGILDGLAIRKPVADTTTVQWFVDIDNIVLNAPGIDPVVVQGPLSQLRSKVTVTNIDPTATAVTLYANGTQIAQQTAPPTDFSSGTTLFTGLTLNVGDVITATQTVGTESAPSASITITQYEVLDDFASFTWTRTPASGSYYRRWYETTSQNFATGAAGTLDGSPAMTYNDSGYMNGAYAIYDAAVPSTKTNYVVSAKLRLVEGTDTAAVRTLELGAQPNGVHRDVTSAAAFGSTTYACHNQALLSVDSSTGSYGSFAGLTGGNNTGTQTVTTGMFSATEGDNLLVCFSTNVHSAWQNIALDTTVTPNRLDTLDPCEGPSGFPPQAKPVFNAQGTWNVSNLPYQRYNTSAAWTGGYLQIDDIHLDLFDLCATVPSVAIGSMISANQTCVTVNGVSASATAINVYTNVNTLIGTLTSGIVAGSNTVTLTVPLVASDQISATQVIGGQEGCKATAPQKTVGDTSQVTRLTVTGPLNAGATSVVVNLVDAAASVVNVYADGTLIGSKNTGIVAGDNTIAVTTLAMHQVIQARQTVPVGCSGNPITSVAGVSQVVGSGHNSSVRLSLGVREVTGLSGPVGAPAYSNGEPIEWIIPIDAGDATSGLKTSGAPIGHKVLTSPDWQTVTFDPVTAGAANVVSFNIGDGALPAGYVGIEHLAITMDQDAKDVGPYKMYVDNIVNGTTVVQDFNTTVTQMFKTPGASGSTAGYLAGNPSASASDAIGDEGRGHRIEWRWIQEGSPTTFMWLRLTSDQTATVNQPGGQPQIDTAAATTMRVFLPCPGPVITAQPSPASQTLTAGSSVTWSVTATSSNPMSYQWYKGAVALADGGSISGATTASLTINPVAEADAGTYSVKVTDVCGTTTSSNVVLGVCVPVSITAQPANQSVEVGAPATFSVTATGSGTLAYQWRKNGTNLTDGGDVSGATTAALTLNNCQLADNGATIDVVVSNGCESPATSTAATLTVSCTGVVITGQPANQTKNVGETATFTVTATGQAPLSYQWKKGTTALVDGGNISGALTATLTLTNVQLADAGSYSCTVTNACGSVDSNAATLTVNSGSVTITAWRSLKTHSGYGEIAITLNAAAVATGQTAGGIKVESRNASAQNGLTKIQIDFSGPVTLGNPAAVTITALSTSGCTSAGANCVSAPKTVTAPTVTILPNGTTMQLTFVNGSAAGDSCYLFTVGAGAVTQTITGDNNCKVRMLQSDSTNDGLINVTDMTQMKTRFGQPVTTANCTSDGNLAGGINVTDMTQAKTRFGRRALCP